MAFIRRICAVQVEMSPAEKSAKRVLVVEDEAIIRLILAETLLDEGYQTVEAATGDEAVSIIDGDGVFDLVVTDIQMPGLLDGLAVGRHARLRDALIPVVYVTGRPESLAGLKLLGPYDALLRKPYGPRDILEVIARMLPA